MEGRFSDQPDPEHGNPFEPAMTSVCVSHAFEKGNRTVEAKNLQKYPKYAFFRNFWLKSLFSDF